MYTNSGAMLAFTLVLLSLFPTRSIFAGKVQSLEKQAIKERMQKLMLHNDFLDERILKEYKEMLAFGKEAYPVLAEMLETTTRPKEASVILAVFIESEGDKTVAIAATKKLLARFNELGLEDTPSASQMFYFASNALAKIGDTKDSGALYPFLRYKNESIRINAMRALAKIGDAKALSRIEQYLSRMKKERSPEELKKDRSIKEGRLAIEVIKKRLSETNRSLNEKKHPPADGKPK